ncbi:FMN-binding protein [Clostridium intestinale]|uniref:FMN-binding protein n=1 Tax=Clostridium intestinale TaxID=36845 RepID=A0A7D7A1L7_9CLOT|nr:FMN-binding protein [Clostridium intestinale]QLY78000.1 FMN-binding protein [Clostridium intestinale]
MKKLGIVFIILIILVVGGFLLMTSNAKKELKAMEYEKIDMNLVSDGVYNGEADAGLVKVKVVTTVKNNAIKKIDIIEHQNGMGGKAEVITDKIIEENSYKVDAISGATLSSEAIKSSVSKSLKEGYSK